MTTPDLADVRERPVTTLDDLTLLWQSLMGVGGFGRRTLWVVFLDSDGYPAPALVPIDDIPLLPRAGDVAGLRQVLEHLEMPSVALLLSRPGPAAEQDSDRQWAEALAPLTPWPVHLATAAGASRAPALVRTLVSR